MKTSPILTDDCARQWRYTESGLIQIQPNYWKPRPYADEIPQPWHYRLFHALLNAASKVRW